MKRNMTKATKLAFFLGLFSIVQVVFWDLGRSIGAPGVDIVMPSIWVVASVLIGAVIIFEDQAKEEE